MKIIQNFTTTYMQVTIILGRMCLFGDAGGAIFLLCFKIDKNELVLCFTVQTVRSLLKFFTRWDINVEVTDMVTCCLGETAHITIYSECSVVNHMAETNSLCRQ